jgi:hypothetical protein
MALRDGGDTSCLASPCKDSVFSVDRDVEPCLQPWLAALSSCHKPVNYHCKGVDISMAAALSEIGYLANPVSTHIQSAEMHNQAVK